MKECKMNDQLKQKRIALDVIDEGIMTLLSKRFEAINEIIEIKRENNIGVEDKNREKEILEKIKQLSSDEAIQNSILMIYDVIIKESKKIQTNSLQMY